MRHAGMTALLCGWLFAAPVGAQEPIKISDLCTTYFEASANTPQIFRDYLRESGDHSVTRCDGTADPYAIGTPNAYATGTPTKARGLCDIEFHPLIVVSGETPRVEREPDAPDLEGPSGIFHFAGEAACPHDLSSYAWAYRVSPVAFANMDAFVRNMTRTPEAFDRVTRGHANENDVLVDIWRENIVSGKTPSFQIDTIRRTANLGFLRSYDIYFQDPTKPAGGPAITVWSVGDMVFLVSHIGQWVS